MPKSRIPIPALIGGISQQSSEFRLPTQLGDKTLNMIGSVTDGLTKRPPYSHEGVLGSAGSFDNAVNSKFHIINTSDTEKNLVAVGGTQEIRAWNMLTGSRKSTDISDTQFKDNTSPTPANLSMPADTAYLATSDPEKDIEFLSLADHTLVLNKSIKPALKATLSTVPDPQCVIELASIPYGQVYTFQISWNDGAAKHNTFSYRGFNSNGQSPDNTQTNWHHANMSVSADEVTLITKYQLEDITYTAAEILAAGSTIGDNLGRMFSLGGSVILDPADWEILRTDHYLIIRNLNGDDFDVRLSSGGSDHPWKVHKDKVQLFTDLPPVGRNGWVMEVEGDEDQEVSTFYKFTSSDSAQVYGYGEWEETQEPGIKYILDEATMPHLVIRQEDGNFQFTPVDGHTYTLTNTFTVPAWGTRAVGSTTTNPDPPFVGKTIRSMFFWKNRLGFLVGDQIVLSEAGEFFNFFRTTIPILPDSARIFVGSGEAQGAQLEHAVPFADHLVIFGESKQFVLRGGEVLSPSSLHVGKAADLDVLPFTKPVSLGSTILAGIPHSEDFAGAAEIHDVGDDERPRLKGVELTKVCPAIIPDNILHMTASPAQGMAVLISNPRDFHYSTNKFFLFSWFDNGDDRVQSAWWPMEMPEGTKIRHAEFIQEKLWILVDKTYDLPSPAYELHLGVIDVSALRYSQLCLDQSVDIGDCTEDGVSAAPDLIVTLPYALEGLTAPSNFKVVGPNGQFYTVKTWDYTGDARKILIEGQSSLPAGTTLGFSYTGSAELSNPVVRDQNGNSKPGRVSVIQTLEVLLRNATKAEVVVVPAPEWPSRANEYRSVWDAQQIGQWVTLTGIPRMDDHFRTFIGEAIDNAVVLLEVTEPFNFRCLNGSWDVRFHARHR